MKKYSLFLLLLFLIPLVSAEGLQFVGLPGDKQTMPANCINGTTVASSANITVFYPNSSLFINNKPMTSYGTGKFNYTITLPTTTGVYEALVKCKITAGGSFAEQGGSFQVLGEDFNMSNIAPAFFIIGFVAFLIYLYSTELKKGGVHAIIAQFLYTMILLFGISILWYFSQVSFGKTYYTATRTFFDIGLIFFSLYYCVHLIKLAIDVWTGLVMWSKIKKGGN